MLKAQSAKLDRKKLFGDPVLITTIVILVILLTLFILYPLSMLLIDSIWGESGLTLSVFGRVLEMGTFRTAFTNTLRLGFIVGIGSTVLGLLFAYVDVYVDIKSRFVRKLFNVVSMLPVVSPPFVLSLSMILLFGRGGLITRSLLHIYDSDIYGLHGIAIVQILTFFPVCYMMLKGLLKNIDPSLEEASRERMLIADKSVTRPLSILCGLFSAFVVLMYISIPFGALFKLWGRDYSLTLKHFQYMFKYSGLKAFRDSFVLSLIASPITALFSMIISYLVVKKKFHSKGFIEFVSMLAMAVPGTVLGVGYIRGFANGVFKTGFLQGLYGTGAILVIVFIVRSLPVGTRSGISALRQIDKSIEESAYDLGAGSGKVFTSVTLPLIKDSFLSGLVTTFVRSITAISAIILLVTPQYLLITTQINEFAEKGKYGVACAYATILIAIVYASIVVMNFVIKHFGTSKKLKGDSENA